MPTIKNYDTGIALHHNSRTNPVICIYDSNIRHLHFQRKGHCSTAVSSAYGGRRTMGVTAVNNAADGRRTMTITP